MLIFWAIPKFPSIMLKTGRRIMSCTLLRFRVQQPETTGMDLENLSIKLLQFTIPNKMFKLLKKFGRWIGELDETEQQSTTHPNKTRTNSTSLFESESSSLGTTSNYRDPSSSLAPSTGNYNSKGLSYSPGKITAISLGACFFILVLIIIIIFKLRTSPKKNKRAFSLKFPKRDRPCASAQNSLERPPEFDPYYVEPNNVKQGTSPNAVISTLHLENKKISENRSPEKENDDYDYITLPGANMETNSFIPEVIYSDCQQLDIGSDATIKVDSVYQYIDSATVLNLQTHSVERVSDQGSSATNEYDCIVESLIGYE